MFSSNQEFKISGDLDQLEEALRFAIKYYGAGSGKDIFYQITSDGKYCLGWHETKNWIKYPFDFDIHIVSEIIKQHLLKLSVGQPTLYDDYDGSTEQGFIMKNITETFLDNEDNIVDPFYGIISIEPYECFYSK